jgi:hypothetical protein
MTADIIPYQAPAAAAAVWRGIRVHNMADGIQLSKLITASGLLPSSYLNAPDPVAACFVALQLGAEVGLSPMASVQNIAIINGRPGLFGPAMLAVVEASGKLVQIEEFIEGEGDARKAVCIVQRVGRKARRAEFSVGDAKRAGLWDKRGKNGTAGPWQQYPERMLQARARSFLLRDVFPDVLSGLPQSVEELQDIPAEPITPPKEEPPKVEEPKAEAPKPAPKPPLLVAIGEGWDPVQFPRGKKGLREALEFMTGAVVDGKPQVVALNNALLDQIAEHIPELADEVSELRAAAAEALRPKDEPDLNAEPDTFVKDFLGDDDFPGDRPLPDEHS